MAFSALEHLRRKQWHLVHSPHTQTAQYQIFASKPAAIVYSEQVGTTTTILTEQTVQVAHEGCGIASKFTKQDVRGCLSTAACPKDHHNITLYYQYYSKQEGLEMGLFWGEKVLNYY